MTTNSDLKAIDTMIHTHAKKDEIVNGRRKRAAKNRNKRLIGTIIGLASSGIKSYIDHKRQKRINEGIKRLTKENYQIKKGLHMMENRLVLLGNYSLKVLRSELRS